MKPLRILPAVALFAGAVAGLFLGPEWLRFALFWTFFFAIPGAVAVRIAGARSAWLYFGAGAITGLCGIIGASYPITPDLTELVAPTVIGGVFGWGWRILLWLKIEHRTEISPLQRTVGMGDGV